MAEAWQLQSAAFQKNLMMEMNWKKSAIYEASLMQARMDEADVEIKHLREEVQVGTLESAFGISCFRLIHSCRHFPRTAEDMIAG